MMEDKFVRFSKLYILIFLSILAFALTIAIIIGLFYGLSSLVSSRPADLIFELLVLTLPPALLTSVYYIFFKRTKSHPSAVVKVISKILFVKGIFWCLATFVFAVIAYFKKGYHDITDYPSFTLAFLAGNIALLFLIALMQAFTSKKEEDWMEKRKRIEKEAIN